VSGEEQEIQIQTEGQPLLDIDLTEEGGDRYAFDCPECGARKKWPTKQRERKSEETLRCRGCGAIFRVLAFNSSHRPVTYSLKNYPPPKTYLRVKGLGRYETERGDAEQCLANWKEDPEGMRSSLVWAITEEIPARDLVARAVKGYESKSKWTPKDLGSAIVPEEINWDEVETQVYE
jgi:transcription elongation factor Elf1